MYHASDISLWTTNIVGTTIEEGDCRKRTNRFQEFLQEHLQLQLQILVLAVGSTSRSLENHTAHIEYERLTTDIVKRQHYKSAVKNPRSGYG
jgi:hypothetical protein